VLPLLLSPLAGCKKIDERRQADLLEVTLRSYESVVRWGSLVNAYGFRRPEDAARDEIPGDLDQIRVVSYQVQVAPAMLDENTAVQAVEIGYIRQDEQSVRKILDRQSWAYDGEKRLWHLASQVPELR
jgi:hypothetical protein